MKKWSICKQVAILILLIQNNSSAQNITLLKTTQLSHYPSASTLEFYNNSLYVIGDDARQILVLDSGHRPTDSILLFEGSDTRIDKDVKADIEASVLIKKEDKFFLLAISSFSTEKRNKTLLLDLEQKTSLLDSAVWDDPPVAELNIEGAAMINKQLLLSNRANNAHPANHLFLASIDTGGNINTENKKVIRLLLPKAKAVVGLSGLAYLQEKDMLLFTASTENTSNGYSDGAIGESFIGYVSGISAKLKEREIRADKLIPLSKIIAARTPQKIESLAIEAMNGKEITLHLAADNDNGQSTLFKIKMELE